MVFFLKNNFFIKLIIYNLIISITTNTAINITNKRFLEESNNLHVQKTIIYENEKVSEYLSNYVDEEGNLFLVTTATKSTKNRLVYALNAKGRNYFLNSNVKIFEFSDKLDDIRNTFITVYDKIKYLVIFDNSKNFQFIDLTNFIKYSTSYVTSNILSQFNTIIPNGDNTFYMCHLSERKWIILNWYYTLYLEDSKFELTDETFKISIRKNRKDQYISEIADFLNCFKSQNFLQCIYEDIENDWIKIGVYDFNNLNALSKIQLKSYSSHCQDCFRKGINIKNDMGAFMYFINAEKNPILRIENIYFNSDNNIKSESIISELDIGLKNLDYKYDYNDLLKITNYRFCFISTFSDDRKKVLFLLFDLYNNYNTLCMRKYKISLNIDGNKIQKNLRLFLYKNFIGYSNTIDGIN